MGRLGSSPLFLLPVAILVAFAVPLGCDDNKTGAFDSDTNSQIKLADIPQLSLRQDRWTTARRSAPIPQLSCVGGTANCATHALPNVVHCFNRGTDGIDVQWECKAELDENFKLGAIDVSCEGYEYPDDPYILQGSCGLRYSLDLRSSPARDVRKGRKSPPEFLLLFIFAAINTLVGAAVILFVLYLIYKTASIVYECCVIIWRAIKLRLWGRANGHESQDDGDASNTRPGTKHPRLRSKNGRFKAQPGRTLNSTPEPAETISWNGRESSGDDSDSSKQSSSGHERTFFSSTVSRRCSIGRPFRLHADSPARSSYSTSPPDCGGGVGNGYRSSSSFSKSFGSSSRSYTSTSFGGTSRR